jgi:hypothetical protein
MANASVRTPSVEATIEATIDDGFVADDLPNVVRYLRENLDLLPVLTRIKDRLEPPLATSMPLRLSLSYDPESEDDPPRLWIRVPTTLDVSPAVEAMDKVDRGRVSPIRRSARSDVGLRVTPFDWRGFLDFADWIDQRLADDAAVTGDDAGPRTAIGRAYYAAFHVARAFADAQV